jgi:hypothetical protein
MPNHLSFPSKALFFCCLSGLVVAVQAQGPEPLPPKRVECNCAELRFTLKPGGSQSFQLPVVQSPVRIEVSETANNGGTQEPSELMYALVNQDPSSKQLTWIGTNNDGSASGSSSLQGKIIARIFGGSAPTTNATLEVVAAPTRTLAIAQNAATTSIPGQYIVKFYF